MCKWKADPWSGHDDSFTCRCDLQNHSSNQVERICRSSTHSAGPHKFLSYFMFIGTEMMHIIILQKSILLKKLALYKILNLFLIHGICYSASQTTLSYNGSQLKNYSLVRNNVWTEQKTKYEAWNGNVSWKLPTNS